MKTITITFAITSIALLSFSQSNVMINKKVNEATENGIKNFTDKTVKEKILASQEYYFPGKNLKIRINKTINPVTGKTGFSSNNNNIKTTQDFNKLVADEEEMVRKTYGSLSRGLRPKFNKMKNDETIKVRVYVKRPDVKYLDKTKHTEEELKQQSYDILKMMPEVPPAAIIKSRDIKNVIKTNRFFFEAELDKYELNALRFDNNIIVIEESFDNQPLLQKSMTLIPELKSVCGDRNFYELARSASRPYPIEIYGDLIYGQGIGTMTLECGIWPDHVDGRNNNPYVSGAILYDSRINFDDEPTSTHSQYTFSCLYYAAPLSNLSHSYSELFSFECEYVQQNIVDWQIRTASASYPRPLEGPDDIEFRIMDNFAYQWPYPVFCNPTGNHLNWPVNWRNYNSISVGNVQHYQLSTFRHIPDHMESGTSWINPPAEYGGPDDREMPHLLAPGYHPDRDKDYWIDMVLPKHKWGCGTSYSAPIANGIAACVMNADSRMLSWPEKVRVALMVTAENIHSGYWDVNSDGQDGCGVINGYEACKFARDHTIVYPEGNAETIGLHADSWYKTDENNKFFNIKTPSSLDPNKHLRIVLVWDSNPGVINNKNYLSDLDLHFKELSLYSLSWNNNVEVIDVPNSLLNPNSVYQVMIKPWELRCGQMDYFYYAIGWTWVNNHVNQGTSKSINDNPLFTEEYIKTKKMLEAYPNPTNNYIILQNVEDNVNYHVISISGLHVLKGTGIRLDISELKPGMYFIKTDSGATTSFIKE